ncbi:MAG: glycine--tRNA ligase [Bacteroidetes bacterium]|nr:MAG: glycine--tRNA ligase [Bacteroidota bacterium]
MDMMEKIVNLCKRRGMIFSSSEIYGGLSSIYDYGHYGVLLKNNVKKMWWDENVMTNEMIIGIDSAVILHPKVWEASGHVSSFTDPLVECKSCHQRFRSDHLMEGKYGEVKTNDGKAKCPQCFGELTEEKKFNLMFKTYIGPVEQSASFVYLRPETAQGIFIDYKTMQAAYSKKIPFGIAQVGRAFRNEITPGNFTFRMREFEQMEIEFFVTPGSDEKWHQYWLDKRMQWYLKLGIHKDHLRLRKHEKNELSHYSKATYDIEYLFPWGWGELEGIANRTDFDLTQHQKYSGRDMKYHDEATKESYIPYVIEPSAGADRATLAFLIDSYKEDGKRVILGLHPVLAPIKVAVFPLVANKEELTTFARQIYDNMKIHFPTIWDDRGNIGKRYYAQDEIGTPWCITIDYQTLTDKTVTIRYRDTAKQIRLGQDQLISYFQKELANTI